MALSVLFGLSWGVGLFATRGPYKGDQIYIRDTFAAIFVILTSFHGLLVFVMHCIRSERARDEWKRWFKGVTGKDFNDVFSSTSPQHSSRQTNSTKFASSKDKITSPNRQISAGAFSSDVSGSMQKKGSFGETSLISPPSSSTSSPNRFSRLFKRDKKSSEDINLEGIASPPPGGEFSKMDTIKETNMNYAVSSLPHSSEAKTASGFTQDGAYEKLHTTGEGSSSSSQETPPGYDDLNKHDCPPTTDSTMAIKNEAFVSIEMENSSENSPSK